MGEKADESRFFRIWSMEMQQNLQIGPLRTRIYIDGYNLYYGCLRNTPYKWLDIVALFERCILPSILLRCELGDTLISSLSSAPSIKYFTAKIVERVARGSDSVSSQARYHTALRKLYTDDVQIIEGYFSVSKTIVKTVDDNYPNRAPRECHEMLVWKIEEKQSDVNISLEAYHDSLSGSIDQVVFVTNDTDIAPALKMIREHSRVKVGLVIPTTDHERVPNTELANLAHWVRTHITKDELASSQLPRVILGRKPTVKPESWYARPDLLHKILALAIPVKGDKGRAFKWMGQPNPYLDNRCPIDLVETEEGAQQVIDYITLWLGTRASEIELQPD
jgi:6-hydroxy-3-succinoylpyridine 3-monooxygenase